MHGLDFVGECPPIERLLQQRDGACFETAFRQRGRISGRHEPYSDRALRVRGMSQDMPADSNAVHARHVQIHQRNIDRVLLEEGQRGGAALRGQNRMSALAEQLSQRRENRLLIVHEEQCAGGDRLSDGGQVIHWLAS